MIYTLAIYPPVGFATRITQEVAVFQRNDLITKGGGSPNNYTHGAWCATFRSDFNIVTFLGYIPLFSVIVGIGRIYWNVTNWPRLNPITREEKIKIRIKHICRGVAEILSFLGPLLLIMDIVQTILNLYVAHNYLAQRAANLHDIDEL